MRHTLLALACLALAAGTSCTQRPAAPTADAPSPIAAPWSHGQLRVSDNHRYLCHADGTPFYWQGETGWLLPLQTDTADVNLYLRRCREEGYNVVQVQTVSNIRQLDSAAYWQNMDYIVRRAEHEGIYIGMVCIWGGMVKAGLLSVDAAQAYGTFLADRYGARPNIVWIIGGDQPGDVRPDVWSALAEAIRAKDSTHLMTYHPRGRTLSATWWNEAPWLDFNMFQSGHRSYGQVKVKPGQEDAETLDDPATVHEDGWRYVAEALAMTPLKPVLDGEPSYERIPHGLHDPAAPKWHAADCRRYAWWSVLAGSCGHTYGNNALMQFYNPDTHRAADGTLTPGAYGCTTSWREAIGDTGFCQMKYLPQLLLRLPYFDRMPDQTVLVGPYGERYERPVASRGSDYILVYTYTSAPLRLDLNRISGQTKRAWWYSPTDGTLTPIGDFPTSADQLFTPLQPHADGHDAVLVVTDAESRYL